MLIGFVVSEILVILYVGLLAVHTDHGNFFMLRMLVVVVVVIA